MGTRGLIGFIIRGRRFGSFNRWDSYPSGLGAEVVAFILSLKEEQLDVMRKRVEDLEWVVADGVHVPRAALLPHILNGHLTCMPDDSDFLNDGLFCEYAYLMDFENRELEYYGYIPGDNEGEQVDGQITIPFSELEGHWLNKPPGNYGPEERMKQALAEMRRPGELGAIARGKFDLNEQLLSARFTVKEYLEMKLVWDEYAREARKRNNKWFLHYEENRVHSKEVGAAAVKFWLDQWTGPIRYLSELLVRDHDRDGSASPSSTNGDNSDDDGDEAGDSDVAGEPSVKYTERGRTAVSTWKRLPQAEGTPS